MSTTIPYCQLSDLLFGNIPTPASAGQYMALAAEEMDSQIGLKYSTPVVVSDNAESRPTRLLLKKINIFLATGRCVMAVSGGGEDDQIHQYGRSLVDEALAALAAIVNGVIVLPGADPVSPDDNLSSGPMVSNVDATSRVEDFTGVFGNPAQAAIEVPRPTFPNPRYDPRYRGW